MMTILRTASDGHRYRPGLFRAVEQFEGPMYYEQRAQAHPIPTATNSWNRVEGAADRVLGDFNALSIVLGANPRNPIGQPTFERLLQSHSALISRVAEFIETISENVAACFVSPGGRVRVAELRPSRRHVDLICNALKHNQNILTPIVGESRGGVVIPGFVVFEVTPGGVQRPNPLIHNIRRAFSFAVEIRRTLAAAYVVGENVGRLIGTASANNGCQRNDESEARRVQLLKQVSQLPIDIFPFEGSRDMPLWEFPESKLTIRQSGGRVAAAPAPIKMITTFTPQIGALSFERP